jgi:hypothetical protein
VSARPLILLGTTLLLLAGSRVSAAQPNPTISVNPGVVAAPLTISTAVAGQEPSGVAASGGTYSVTLKKNRGIGSITAKLNAPLPAGTTLTITLAAPGGGATSVGPVQLTTSPQPVVLHLPNKNSTFSNVAITYSFSATSAAGVLALRTATVTLALAP